jgi:uncharacterized protein YhdP
MHTEAQRHRGAADAHTLQQGRLPWAHWQADVVKALRIELGTVDPAISLADIDWEAWRSLFDDGYAPHAAVLRALERDL